MAGEAGIFDEKEEIPVTPETPPTNPFDDQLKAFVNEAGEPKYKDVNAALNALKASQEFIATLKSEKTQVEQDLLKAREELTKLGSIDDYVNRLKEVTSDDQPKETPKAAGGLSEDQVAAILEKTLQAREVASVAQSNLKRVEEELVKTQGDQAPTFIKQRASELHMTVAQLKELSSKSPEAALTLLGVQSKKPITPISSTQAPKTETPSDGELPRFEQGVSRGGLTNKELVERLNKVKEYTYKRLEVKT